MSNNDIPFEVICIKKDSNGFTDHSGWTTEIGNKYTVIEICNGMGKDGGISTCYTLLEDPDRDEYCHISSKFRRIAKSFTNALTASLAAQVEVGDGVDIIQEPVKIEI